MFGVRNKKTLLILLAIAGVIRLWGLGELGMGFFRDEAALGYNIYSIPSGQTA